MRYSSQTSDHLSYSSPSDHVGRGAALLYRRGMPNATPEEIEAAATEMGRRVGRWIVIGFVILMGASCVGGGVVAIWMAVFGEASIYLYHQSSEPIEVWVDGALDTAITSAGVTVVRLSRGDHQMEIRGATKQAWDLPGMNGLDDYLIPTDPETCFAVVDVTYALYEYSEPEVDICKMDLDDARIIDTYRGFPMEVGGPKFTVDELPERSSSVEFLTLPVRCDVIEAASGGALLRRHLGCL